jgi:predicted O-linked N-acetylglucosamine transferase (SPINDLY family)
LKAIGDKLAANRTSAPLFDTARFTRNLEAAYATMLAEKTGF